MNLPWEVVDSCNGFSVDIGGSSMKFVYIDKNDWKEPSKREKGSRGKVNFKSLPHKNFDTTEAFDFIENTVYMKKSMESPVVYGTGFGSSVLTPKFKERFGLKIQCEDEFTSFTSALAYIAKHVPRQDILCNSDDKEKESIFSQGKTGYQLNLATRRNMEANKPEKTSKFAPDGLISLQKSVYSDLDKPLAAIQDLFPCILVMCGSGFGSLLVSEDGSCEIINTSPMGGKFWTGVGSTLTDAKDYSELMTLAESGNHRNADLVVADVLGFKREDGDDFYQKMPVGDLSKDIRTVFGFSKVSSETKGDIKQEDLARSMLNTIVTNTVYLGFSAARITHVRHVFYVGGFVSHPLIQKLMFQQWINTWCEAAGYSERVEPVAVHFLQQGSFLGALGSLLRNVNQQSTKL